MESIKQSVEDLASQFDTKLAEYQQTLLATASPTSNIAAQFNIFRTFVLTGMESLQLQLKVLTSQVDELEMRRRRKILLVHGIPETANENTTSATVKALSDHIKIPELECTAVSRSQRLGRMAAGKPRPILIKFNDLGLRNKIWYSKTNLKNTGITLSEFLTKGRHKAFMAARQCFGVSKCWTKEGQIIIIGPDGTRHRIVSTADLKVLMNQCEVQEPAPTTDAASIVKVTPSDSNLKGAKTAQSLLASRPKRNIKK